LPDLINKGDRNYQAQHSHRYQQTSSDLNVCLAS